MAKMKFLWRSSKPLFHTMPPKYKLAIALLGGLYLAACSILWFKQRSMIFHPMPARTPAEGSVMLREGSSQFWLTKARPPADSTPAVCSPGPAGRSAAAYFGGNAEPASAFGSKAAELPGCDLYALDYPGFEGAPGSPSEESIHAAADAMMARMARDGVDLSRSILIGRSLGSGEAVRQASLLPCNMAILATPYDSLTSVAIDHAPWAPVSLLIRDPFPAVSWAAHARCPALVFYADFDQTIPPVHAQSLADAWSPAQGSRLVTVEGITHSNIMDSKGVWTTVRSTLAAYQAKMLAHAPNSSAR